MEDWRSIADIGPSPGIDTGPGPSPCPGDDPSPSPGPDAGPGPGPDADPSPDSDSGCCNGGSWVGEVERGGFVTAAAVGFTTSFSLALSSSDANASWVGGGSKIGEKGGLCGVMRRWVGGAMR